MRKIKEKIKGFCEKAYLEEELQGIKNGMR